MLFWSETQQSSPHTHSKLKEEVYVVFGQVLENKEAHHPLFSVLWPL